MLQSKQHIGGMDRKITIQSPVYQINTASNEREITGWEDVATVYAKIEDSAGSEVFQAEQVEGIRGTIFTIRYREIDVTWRISFDGEYYNIVPPKRLDRKRYLAVLGFIGQDYKEEA